MTFVWDAPAGVPGDRTERHASRVILTARGADDAVIFEGLVLPTGPRAAEERAGRLARAVFDTPPGRLRLQMKIEDAASRVIDSDVRDLAIREWRSAVALGAPEVLRARNAREFRALDADPDAVPVASREFSRAERLVVRFQAYVPRGAEPLVSATLVGRSGRAMRELKVDARPMLDGRSQVDVPLAGLAPGEYAIELAATCRDGAARDRFEFRVTH